VAAETGFKLASNPDTVRAPDVGFIRAARVPSPLPRGYAEVAPDLATEADLRLDCDHLPRDTCRESREDSTVRAEIDDYIAFGIPHIWVIDPKKHIGWDCSDGNWLRKERFEVTGSPIYLSLDELFQQIAAEEA